MRKILLFIFVASLMCTKLFAQTENSWSAFAGSQSALVAEKAIKRQSFPKDYKLFSLNQNSLSAALYRITGSQSASRSAIISLPNVDGQLEQFMVVEASNFTSELQNRFPQIRAFSGKGITDRSATLKLSISPAGIQSMVFRSEKASEFIEPYSADHKVYAVYTSQRAPGKLPWTCSTDDQRIFTEIRNEIPGTNFTNSSTGELKTMRLAQSCNGEYSNYFSAFSSADVALVLAAFNGTLTRCNGIYEKDLALHLNLIPQTVDVIFYDPATDPYTILGAWNGQLQATLTSVIGEANYDIGHMFGASGGGGNAGCIGCVCVDGVKGRGITSPADDIPTGDNFDIDYVAHEVGHQLGGNHTFSQSNEGTGVNKEVGSGITIMGYAGLTAQDVTNHSIDIFHQTSIEQIQTNLATKTCPITTVITATNATPVIAPVPNYTIPISTPFAIRGSATDANQNDVLTYCWEQNDNSTTTGANSVASPTKLTGPNWLTFPATINPTRTFPRLSTILAGLFVTGPLPGGDAGANIEALSSVSRTLNFRLTVRDNSLYTSTPPIKVGQTAFTDMVVTTTATSGPFEVVSPNSNVNWPAGSTQEITWSVNNSNLPPVSCANVRITLSRDGGQTFPVVLIASTPNDGTETLTIPGPTSTTARVRVEAIGNIFFDISNTNFTISVPAMDFNFVAPAATTVSCSGPATASVTLATTASGGYNVPISLSATAGVPAGTTLSFSANPITPGASTVITLNNVNTLNAGSYNITITGVSGTITKTQVITFTVAAGPVLGFQISPASQSICAGSPVTFTALAAAATSYQWQFSTNGGVSFSNIIGATSASYSIASVSTAQNDYRYRVVATNQCSTGASIAATLNVLNVPAIGTQPINQTVCIGTNATFLVGATGAGLQYQWQLSIDNGVTFNNISGANAVSFTAAAVTSAQNNYRYRVVVSGTCLPAITSNAATLTVGDAATISIQPQPVIICAGANATFNVTASGTSLIYQWQVSTDNGATFTNISGATAASYTLNSAAVTANNNQYRVIVFSCTPTGITSSTALLTVNTPISIATQPQNSTICEGTNTSFTVTASGIGVGYQWQYAAGGCTGTYLNIAGATTATLNLNNVSTTNAGAYRVIVSGTCGNVTSACATLVVNTAVVITAQPADQSECIPIVNSATFTIAATGTGVTFQWQVSPLGSTAYTNVAGATSNTLTITPLTAALNGNKYRVQLSGTCTPALTSNVVTLVVNTQVAITKQPEDVSGCTEGTTSFSVTATGSTITYQWQVSLNGGPFVNLANGSVYSGVTSPTLNVNNLATNLSGNVYRVVVSGVPCGSVNSTPSRLTVNPKPGVVLTLASNAAITPYIRTGLFVTTSPQGLYYFQWFKNGVATAALNGNNIPLTVDDFGDYEVVATNLSTGCASRSNKVTVTPAPSTTLFIYPNPNNGSFQVRYFNQTGANVSRSINVYDSRGAKVFAKTFTLSGIYPRMDVDLNKISAKGVYFVDLLDGSGKRLKSERIVVE